LPQSIESGGKRESAAALGHEREQILQQEIRLAAEVFLIM
jgi:hypothetical protein